jgi:hypothetical protein
VAGMCTRGVLVRAAGGSTGGARHSSPGAVVSLARRTPGPEDKQNKSFSSTASNSVNLWSISQVRHAATREWHQGLHTVSARSALRWVRGGG